MFLSIFLASCRPSNIIAFLNNLAETADDYSNFEVLIKVDEGDEATVATIESQKKLLSFKIIYAVLPRLNGYYSLNIGYNKLFKISDSRSYFCWLLTDEIRFTQKGWDSIIKKYIKHYPDDIFRIKLSLFQLKNYYDFAECMSSPDNYAITTRKWLELTGGWGDFWGPDSWHQCIDFFLGLCKDPSTPGGIFRSFPIFEIDVQGQEAGEGIVDPVALARRAAMIDRGWKRHSTHKAQEKFMALALRLKAHILASERNINKYVIEEDNLHKTISLIPDNNETPLFSWGYRLPNKRLRLYCGIKRCKLRNNFNQLWLLYFSPYTTVKRYAYFILRWSRCLLRLFRISLTANYPSIRKKVYFFDGEKLCSITNIGTEKA